MSKYIVEIRTHRSSCFLFLFFFEFQTQIFLLLLASIFPLRSPWTYLFSSKLSLFVKIVCCRIDQSHLRPFDGKYRSATAPLVHLLFPKTFGATNVTIEFVFPCVFSMPGLLEICHDHGKLAMASTSGTRIWRVRQYLEGTQQCNSVKMDWFEVGSIVLRKKRSCHNK